MRSSKLKLTRLIIVSALCVSFTMTHAQVKLIDQVVAKVGSEYILLSDVEEEYSYAKSKNPSLNEDVKCAILDNLIAQKLIVYQAKLDSVEVSDSEVEAQLNYRFDAILQQMNGDEAFFEEYYGASVNEMKDRYREDQKQKILAERMQDKLMADIEITPKEVEAFFNKIPTDSLPYYKSEMEISEIVTLPKVNPISRQKALDKITDIRDKVIKGEMKFEDAASKYSMDPGSAVKGGDLGFAKRGVYVPEFEATVFSLSKDEISDIIETEFGFHFIQLLERRGNSVRARHILIKPEITEDDLEKVRVLLDSVRTLVVNDSMTFPQAVLKYSVKTIPSYANSGRVKNYNTNNTFFAADDLDPDTYFAVYNLKPGDISKPILITMPDGMKAYRLVQLNSISKPHKANFKEDFDKISEYAKDSKKNEYFLKWLYGKRNETYIEISPLFKDCNLEARKS
ncbi:MAG: PpiC-type peptidyl-prolyl cis-trans isomerase [Bacteroidetes bacterium OLB9]|nr:MAG: PpiC-type peptidyl-prolyl cis-trans isomerase [Bacteroidetes bacterium OLB9]